MNTLVLYAHPDYQNSFANKIILDEFSKINNEAQILNIAKEYPDGKIDVEAEQKRLLDADILVLEFPFWWYSAPSLMHRYIEQVFTHGFAYGSEGNALQGMKLILSFTAGGDREAYTKAGYQHYEIEDFMPQFIAMANLTGMELAGTIVSYGMTIFDPDDNDHIAEVEKEAKDHGQRLADMVKKCELKTI